MLFNPRFYYDSGAPEGGGGADPNAAPPVVIPDDVQKELAELRAYKESIVNKEPDKTPDQIAKEAELEKAELIKYSAENDLMKVDDFNKFETLKAKADKDLVFDKFSTEVKDEITEEVKAENPDATEEEISAKIKEAFEKEFPLESKNAKAKARAEAKLQREAKEIRTPLESTYNTAKERYSESREIVSKIPEFNKLMDDVIKDSTPEKLIVKTKDGEQEIDIEVELNKEQRAEIEKLFKNEKVFGKYYNSDEKEKGSFKASIQKKIEGYLKANHFDAAVSKGFEQGVKIGTAKGSTVGAKNPFPLQQGTKQEAKVVTLDESTAKVAAARERVGR